MQEKQRSIKLQKQILLWPQNEHPQARNIPAAVEIHRRRPWSHRTCHGWSVASVDSPTLSVESTLLPAGHTAGGIALDAFLHPYDNILPSLVYANDICYTGVQADNVPYHEIFFFSYQAESVKVLNRFRKTKTQAWTMILWQKNQRERIHSKNFSMLENIHTKYPNAENCWESIDTMLDIWHMTGDSHPCSQAMLSLNMTLHQDFALLCLL